MPNKDNIQINKADAVAKKLYRLYSSTINEIVGSAKGIKLDDNVPFDIRKYPAFEKKVNEALNKLTSNSVSVIQQATKEQWLEAYNKNIEIATPYLKRKLLTEAQQLAYTNKNLEALSTFQKRKINGLKLSDRVWKYSNQFKGEIEMGIDVALTEGISAQKLSQNIRKYLDQPEKLFRRVRDKYGNLQLSKMAQKYRPGAGVYRSSYKNAMRLARTEVNMAYRASDFEKYKQFDFVIGFEVKRSNRVFGCSVCEGLKGKYPKTFRFVGWHPQCYSDDTEVLTDNGWKLFDELKKEDKIFSLEPITKNVEYVEYVNYFKYEKKGKMIHYSNRSLDLLVTSDHKMVYVDKNDGKTIKTDKIAKDFSKNIGGFYRSSEYDAEEKSSISIGKHNIDFNLYSEFMAYYLAEGSISWTRKNQFSIAQSKEKHFENYKRIELLLSKLPFKYTALENRFYLRDADMYKYLKRFGKSINKYIPIQIKESSPSQIKIFLDAYVKCDGHSRDCKSFIGNRGTEFNSTKKEKMFFTSSTQMASDIGELLIKIGSRPSYYIDKVKGVEKKHHNGIYIGNEDMHRIRECYSKTATVYKKEYIDYNGYVYDIELERNHILYVRRNGKCVWGSNCRCYTVPILNNIDKFIEQQQAILNGETYKPSNIISSLPNNFQNWYKDNLLKISSAKSLPYFLKDNKNLLKINFDSSIPINDINRLISNKEDSFLLFTSNKEYAKQREIIHKKIIEDYLGNEKLIHNTSDTHYLLGGATANGKSTLEKSGFLPHPKGSLVIDADKIKKMLPEYKKMLNSNSTELVQQAANFVHNESSYLKKKIESIAYKNNYTTVLDGTNDGSIKSMIEKIEKYRKETQKRIRADYVTLDSSLSLKLAMERAIKTNRFVPETFIKDINRDVSILVPKLLDKKLIDELYLWDTNINGKPVLILKQINGKTTIFREDLYKSFKNKRYRYL